MVDLQLIRRDLRDEHEDLDAILSSAGEAAWEIATPAEGWSVRDQISHLAFFDEQALRAVVDAVAFRRGLEGAAADVEGLMAEPLEGGRRMPPVDLMTWWRRARTEMLEAFSTLDPSRRVAWFGPPMSPASFVSARVMETWAHGQDVADALGVVRSPTDRLRHVAHLGVRARPNSYVARGLPVPAEDVRVVLAAPSGERWAWNEGAAQTVSGPALDFCLVVTQRRHPQDTDLVAEGPLAQEWMSIAQAFAGPPGKGRRPGQFARA